MVFVLQPSEALPTPEDIPPLMNYVSLPEEELPEWPENLSEFNTLCAIASDT